MKSLFPASLICPILVAFVFSANLFGQAVVVEKDSVQSGDKVVRIDEQDADRQDSDKKDADKKDRASAENKLKQQIAHYLRVRYDSGQKPVAMETSVTRFIKTLDNGEDVYVDLIGVVHIGEKEYYQELNKIFENYDAVLYELVAPEGTRIPKGGRESGGGMNPLAALQNTMKSGLSLDFQLDHIDYTKNNLVHADMTPEEFVESMEKNDESFFKMAMKAIGQSIASQNKPGALSDTDIIAAMMSKNPTVSMRRLMAEQMQDLDSGMVIFQGKDGSTIIHHRNKKAFKVLDREIEDGKKRIAVFYGAGHLPDMEDLLMKDRGMKRGGQYWLEAWNLRWEEE